MGMLVAIRMASQRFVEKISCIWLCKSRFDCQCRTVVGDFKGFVCYKVDELSPVGYIAAQLKACFDMRMVLVGGGRLCNTIVRHFSNRENEFIGFFDDDCLNSHRYGIPHLGPIGQMADERVAGKYDNFVMAIGYRHLMRRGLIFNFLAHKFGLPFAPLIHETAVIGHGVTVNQGVIAMANSVVDVGTSVGTNTLVNIGCLIAHDCSIGPHSFLAPGVKFAGNCITGERCFFGIGSTMINSVEVGDDCFVAAGALVTKSVPNGSSLIGVPARCSSDSLFSKLT
jgi:acetyltransferase EpsM